MNIRKLERNVRYNGVNWTVVITDGDVIFSKENPKIAEFFCWNNILHSIRTREQVSETTLNAVFDGLLNGPYFRRSAFIYAEYN